MSNHSKSNLALLSLASASTLAYWWWKRRASQDNDDDTNDGRPKRLSFVTPDNETLLPQESEDSWRRATYVLVMHEPPHLFYEPKEWSHTSLILLKTTTSNGNGDNNNTTDCLQLPGGLVRQGETYAASAIDHLLDIDIDVCQPENCLHHLFTFPWEEEKIWGDCYECVYRGQIPQALLDDDRSVCLSLAQLQDMLLEDDHLERFAPDSCHALKLYFQRQGDLRAKRRLLKGYASDDLAHYGLRSEKAFKLVLKDFNSQSRQEAVDFTMKTDDGMNVRLLHEADIILLGVSRSGKTPLSIFLSQTAGLKVANVPLVFELSPPKELTDDPRIDPLRVFCLTRDELEMETLRKRRLERAFQGNSHVGTPSTYANFTYITKDLAKARNLAQTKGYTEIDVTERALEECASIIVSKMKERFPNMHIH